MFDLPNVATNSQYAAMNLFIIINIAFTGWLFIIQS